MIFCIILTVTSLGSTVHVTPNIQLIDMFTVSEATSLNEYIVITSLISIYFW